MSWPLLKYFIKKNWWIVAALTAFIMFELVVTIAMFDLIKDMDFLGLGGTTVQEFTISALPSLLFMFTMLFYILIIYFIIVRPIDTTSMSSHLASGIRREKYLTSAFVFLAVSLLSIFVVIFVICGLLMLIWVKVDWAEWLYANVTVFTGCLAVASISFFFASVFPSHVVGKLGMIGLPVLFLILFMMYAQFPNTLEFFRWITPFGWINIMNSSLWWMWNLIYLAVTGAFITASVFLFKKKQLSI